MYKFFGLVLLSALAAVGAERTKFNDALDVIINDINNKQRQEGATSAVLPDIQLDSKFKYSQAVLLGVDSLKRTDDAWKEVKGNDVTFDISYGFGMLAIELPILEINGTKMSAYARVRDNSIRLSFTLQNIGVQCHAKLNEFRVEKMENVEFGTSDPDYDDFNLDDFFKSTVVPTLNAMVQSNFANLERPLQALCKLNDFLIANRLQESVMWHL